MKKSEKCPDCGRTMKNGKCSCGYTRGGKGKSKGKSKPPMGKGKSTY